MPICETCLHRVVCGKYKATGGVNKCRDHKEERHGRWIITEDGLKMECSNCRASVKIESGVNKAKVILAFANNCIYCYRCGTPMDGGNADG